MRKKSYTERYPTIYFKCLGSVYLASYGIKSKAIVVIVKWYSNNPENDKSKEWVTLEQVYLYFDVKHNL